MAPIVQKSCALAGCHAANSQFPDLSDVDKAYTTLTTEDSRQALGIALIAAGSAPTSYVINKLEDAQGKLAYTCDPEGCGLAMPVGPALTDEELSTFIDWVTEGAAK